jgi:hypothetical protein
MQLPTLEETAELIRGAIRMHLAGIIPPLHHKYSFAIRRLS